MAYGLNGCLLDISLGTFIYGSFTDLNAKIQRRSNDLGDAGDDIMSYHIIFYFSIFYKNITSWAGQETHNASVGHILVIS